MVNIDRVVLYTGSHVQDGVARKILKDHKVPFVEYNDHELGQPVAFYNSLRYKGLDQISSLAESFAESQRMRA